MSSTVTIHPRNKLTATLHSLTGQELFGLMVLPPPLLVPLKQALTLPRGPPESSPHPMLFLALSRPPHVRQGVGDNARTCPGE